MRSVVKPCSRNCSVRPCEAGSETRPPGSFTGPVCISPFRNVPAVSTTHLALKVTPRQVVTPVTRPFSISRPLTESCQIERFEVFSRIFLHRRENSILSLCERGLHTAGPLERLSIRNCMALSSVTTPIMPPRASISLTICPLAIPPTAGLQLIWAILFMSIVISRVDTPRRAAA